MLQQTMMAASGPSGSVDIGGAFERIETGGARSTGLAGSLRSRSRRGSRRMTEADHRASFKGWNRVGITRVAMRLAGIQPRMGIPVSADEAVEMGVRKMSSATRRNLSTFHPDVVEMADVEVQSLPANHRFRNLLNRPNPIQPLWHQFSYFWDVMFGLFGYYNMVCNPSNLRTQAAPEGEPAELWVIPERDMRPLRNRDGVVYAYEIRPHGIGSRPATVPASYVIRDGFGSPEGVGIYDSPTDGMREWLRSAESVEEARAAGFDQGVNPDVWVNLDANVYKNAPGEEAMDEIRKRFDKRYAGVENNRRAAVMPPGVSAQMVGNSPREMDFPTSADELMKWTLAGRGINKFIAGLSEDMNRADTESALVGFAELVANPTLHWKAHTLTRIAQTFYDPRIVVWFDDTRPFNAEEDRADAIADFQMGAMSPNDRRMMRGRETIDEPGYNSGYVAGGLTPLSEDAAPTIPEPEPGEMEDDEDASEEREDESGEDDEDDSEPGDDGE